LKAARERRGVGIRIWTRVIFGSTVRLMLAEPFTELLQPCGKCRLVGWWLVAIIVSAREGHGLDSETPLATLATRSRPIRRPEAARTILSGSGQVKNSPIRIKPMEMRDIWLRIRSP
jgi:hypothetical protein